MLTENLKLRLLYQNQAAKEVVVNENFIFLDEIINKAVTSFVEELPTSASNGDIYILSEEAKINPTHIALKKQDQWFFIPPYNACIFFVINENAFYFFKDSKWVRQSKIK